MPRSIRLPYKRFQVPTDLDILFEQFTHTKKFPHEPMINFNYRFQNAYSKLIEPYIVELDLAIQIYLRALDPFIIAFMQKEIDIRTLQQAYTSVACMEKKLQQNTEGERATKLRHLLENLNLKNTVLLTTKSPKYHFTPTRKHSLAKPLGPQLHSFNTHHLQ